MSYKLSLMINRFRGRSLLLGKRNEKTGVREREMYGAGIFIPGKQGYNFDAIEEIVAQGLIGFGNPRSKLTQIEQFHLWKKMIQEGSFHSRDEFDRIVLTH